MTGGEVAGEEKGRKRGVEKKRRHRRIAALRVLPFGNREGRKGLERK